MTMCSSKGGEEYTKENAKEKNFDIHMLYVINVL